MLRRLVNITATCQTWSVSSSKLRYFLPPSQYQAAHLSQLCWWYRNSQACLVALSLARIFRYTVFEIRFIQVPLVQVNRRLCSTVGLSDTKFYTAFLNFRETAFWNRLWMRLLNEYMHIVWRKTTRRLLRNYAFERYIITISNSVANN